MPQLIPANTFFRARSLSRVFSRVIQVDDNSTFRRAPWQAWLAWQAATQADLTDRTNCKRTCNETPGMTKVPSCGPGTKSCVMLVLLFLLCCNPLWVVARSACNTSSSECSLPFDYEGRLSIGVDALTLRRLYCGILRNDAAKI